MHLKSSVFEVFDHRKGGQRCKHRSHKVETTADCFRKVSQPMQPGLVRGRDCRHNADMSAPRRSPARSAKPKRKANGAPPAAYWQATREPLHALLFLFPLVAIYELGTLILRSTTGWHDQLVAHELINSFLRFFGAHGAWLPGVALLLTLLIWHVLARHPWHIQGWAMPLMLAESVLYAVPLLVITQLRLSAGSGLSSVLVQQTILAVGAGIYEELVFRLYLITGIMLLLNDVCRVRRSVAVAVAVVIPALLFAFCHVQPIGVEVFAWGPFAARMAAGVYLSMVFVGRGFGIAVGCHAAHNIALLWIGSYWPAQ